MHSMMKVGNWDRDQQALNKSRRGCLDAHLISEVAIKMCRKVLRKTLNIAYIDFQKAYDSVSHIGLLKILEKTVAGQVCLEKQRLLNTLKTLMTTWKTFIVNVKGSPISIPIKRGIFQGDKMSPTLFCVALTLLKASRKDTVKLTDSG